MYKSCHGRLDSLNERFDASIRQIFYISSNLVPRRNALCKISETYALNLPADEQPSRYRHGFNVQRSVFKVQGRRFDFEPSNLELCTIRARQGIP
jgi:hypothetical protein